MTIIKNIWICLWIVVAVLPGFFLTSLSVGAIIDGTTTYNFYLIVKGIVGLSIIGGILKTVLDRLD